MTEGPGATTRQARLVGGRYLLREPLGRGGMGTVWRAEDQVIGRSVAVKELHLPDGLAPAERQVFADRVLREARTAGRLTAPGVVTVHDVLTEHGSHYIVMELVQAPTLEDVVRRQGPLAPAAVASIGLQVLDALEAAHSAGVVHRDVKPSNIMLLPDGRVKLTDFGIAQAADDPRLTSTGSLIGSPGYMSPERLQANSVAPIGDLWSLGATLFFAVEGRGPFDKDTAAATMVSVMSDVPFLVHCQGPLASVIMGLLVHAPEGRLTAQQVRPMLQRVAAGDPASAPTTRLTGSAGPTAVLGGGTPAVRRARRAGLALVAVLAAAALLAAGFGLGRWRAPDVVGAEATVLTYGGDGDVTFEGFWNEGTCITGQLVAGRDFPTGSTTQCDDPHDAEIVSVADTYGATERVAWPGVDTLAAYGRAACRMALDTVVDSPAEDDLQAVALVPSESAWNRDEEGVSPARSVLCTLTRSDGTQMTGQLYVQPAS